MQKDVKRFQQRLLTVRRLTGSFIRGSYYITGDECGGRRKDRNTSGQRGNKFNNSYRDISVVVAGNNSVVKPKCEQYTSLNKMSSDFSYSLAYLILK